MGVILLCRNNVTLGAKINTKVTLLAKFFVYLDMTFHVISPKQFNAFDSLTLAHVILLITKRKSRQKRMKVFRLKVK